MKIERAVCLLVLVAASFVSAGEPATWKAGVATVAITPQENIWLAGYAARTRPAEGTAQPLQAKALALEDAQGGRFVFVTIDSIGVTRALRQGVERRVREAYQLRPDEFLINASHTHSGPEHRPARVPTDADGKWVRAAEAYAKSLEEAMVALIGRALQDARPARLSYARARAGFAMNRRLPQPGGEPRNAPYPDGPVDHDVPVLRVEDGGAGAGGGGALRAVLFGYACHNTTLTQAWYQYCGDYAGFAQEYLQADRPGTVAMFITGCGGDQNPYPRGTIELARAHGRTMATAVEAALATQPRPVQGELRSALAEIELKYAGPPTREDYERKLNSKDKQEAAHAQRMIERLEREGKFPAGYPYPVQVVRLGDDLTLVALSGEVVVDYSLRLKRELGGPASVWLAGYCNDVMGYIPSERVLREGGYEGATAMRLGVHPGPWASGLEEQIVGKVRELVERTKQESAR